MYSSSPLNIFIQHEFLMCLENIVEKGKGDTLNSHKKEEVCKIQKLIFYLNFSKFSNNQD
jgi:hypothetical protein